MGPLMEAMMVFVGIPAGALAILAGLVYGVVTVVSGLRPAQPVAQPARVVAFPGARPVVIRSADAPDVRKAA